MKAKELTKWLEMFDPETEVTFSIENVTDFCISSVAVHTNRENQLQRLNLNLKAYH